MALIEIVGLPFLKKPVDFPWRTVSHNQMVNGTWFNWTSTTFWSWGVTDDVYRRIPYCGAWKSRFCCSRCTWDNFRLNQRSPWKTSRSHTLTLFFDLLNKPYVRSPHMFPSVPCSENIEQSPSVSWPREFYPSPPTVGDWNGVGRLQSDRLGHLRHLKNKTAQSGLEQRRWLANITMQCIDQSHAIGTRGTWQHPGNKDH